MKKYGADKQIKRIFPEKRGKSVFSIFYILAPYFNLTLCNPRLQEVVFCSRAE